MIQTSRLECRTHQEEITARFPVLVLRPRARLISCPLFEQKGDEVINTAARMSEAAAPRAGLGRADGEREREREREGGGGFP